VDALRPFTGETLTRVIDRLRNPKPGGKVKAASQFGVDITSLIEQIKLPPAAGARRGREDQKQLCDAGVDFVVIGGWAAMFGGLLAIELWVERRRGAAALSVQTSSGDGMKRPRAFAGTTLVSCPS
jgi:hypothetical protein